MDTKKKHQKLIHLALIDLNEFLSALNVISPEKLDYKILLNFLKSSFNPKTRQAILFLLEKNSRKKS